MAKRVIGEKDRLIAPSKRERERKLSYVYTFRALRFLSALMLSIGLSCSTVIIVALITEAFVIELDVTCEMSNR